MLFRRRIETTSNQQDFQLVLFVNRGVEMETQSDEIGGVLREFYSTYGIPGEGPPQDFNVTALLGTQST